MPLGTDASYVAAQRAAESTTVATTTTKMKARWIPIAALAIRSFGRTRNSASVPSRSAAATHMPASIAIPDPDVRQTARKHAGDNSGQRQAPGGHEPQPERSAQGEDAPTPVVLRIHGIVELVEAHLPRVEGSEQQQRRQVGPVRGKVAD